jgi:hypothetical protein
MRIPQRELRFWNPSAIAWRRAAGAIALAFSTLGTPFLPGCVFETERKGPVILFMGNSITLHDTLPAVGWHGTWGMAATASDKDYVHRTVARLKDKGMDVDARIGERNCVPCDGAIDEQAHAVEQLRRLRPRYAVVQLSENNFDIELRSGKMTAQYKSLLRVLKDEGVPHVYCLGAWGEKGPDDARATAIKAALWDFPEYRFLDISALAQDTLNYGDTTVFKNAFVAWHPGDRGMDGIASVIAEAVWADR